MTLYLYTAWFRDTTCSPNEEDYEWCRCLGIDGSDTKTAQEWGDELAARYTKKYPSELFLHSTIEISEVMASTKCIAVGEDWDLSC